MISEKMMMINVSVTAQNSMRVNSSTFLLDWSIYHFLPQFYNTKSGKWL